LVQEQDGKYFNTVFALDFMQWLLAKGKTYPRQL